MLSSIFSLCFGFRIVCLGLFALPVGVPDRLWSVILVIPMHFLNNMYHVHCASYCLTLCNLHLKYFSFFTRKWALAFHATCHIRRQFPSNVKAFLCVCGGGGGSVGWGGE